MKISILKLAHADLKEIREYLSEFGENPPKKFRKSFKDFCNLVTTFSLMHPEYEHNTNYRKAVLIFDYLVFYKVEENNILIYRVLHGMRDIENIIND